MTNSEIRTIQNIIRRLQRHNCGCHFIDFAPEGETIKKMLETAREGNLQDVEIVSRLYLNSWVIPALQMLLPGERRNPKLAEKLSQN